MIDKKNEKSKPDLIGPHGGYRNLKSYQTAEIIYDATAVFCNLFVNKHSRTHDQMVQVAQQLRQLEKQFLKEGGFTEKLYQVRQQAKRK